MAGKFCVLLGVAKDNVDKATVAFVVANAAVASDKETMVFLTLDGTRISQKGYTDGVQETGFAPLKDLVENFLKAGGKVWVCSPCFKKRGLVEAELIAGATLVGGAKLVEFLSDGAASVSFV